MALNLSHHAESKYFTLRSLGVGGVSLYLLRSFWRACPSKLQRRREAERRQVRVAPSASFQDAATRCLRSASARRRSTCGSSQRDVGPKGSGPGQASWDVVSLGVIQCLLSQSSGSTPRTGRNAGEHDARTRPRAECMAPPAGAAPAPPWLSTLGRRRP